MRGQSPDSGYDRYLSYLYPFLCLERMRVQVSMTVHLKASWLGTVTHQGHHSNVGHLAFGFTIKWRPSKLWYIQEPIYMHLWSREESLPHKWTILIHSKCCRLIYWRSITRSCTPCEHWYPGPSSTRNNNQINVASTQLSYASPSRREPVRLF